MINIQNKNEQEQIIQQSIPNFQEKDFYSFLEPGEQKDYLSVRNSCCCSCGKGKDKREKCFRYITIIACIFNIPAIGTCLYVSEDYRALRKILKGMILKY